MARILVIDDDEQFNQLIKDYLSSLGHHVSAAYNGQEGFASYENCHPDIVLSDIRMPKKDGLDLLLKFRNHNEHIPKGIILMSGVVNTHTPEYQMTLKALGATSFLQKPFPLEELSNTIDQLLSENSGL